MKSRLLTALVLLPLAVAAVLWLPTPAFALLVGGVVAAAAWELTHLAGLESVPGRLAAVALLAAGLVVLWFQRQASWVFDALGLLALWWLLALGMLLLRRRPLRPLARFRPLRLLAGGVLLAGAWLAVVRLHQMPAHGHGLVLVLLVLNWLADSAAYFTGRSLGRHKLAPRISPGKTIEGALGGVASALLPAAALGALGWLALPAGTLVLLCLATAAVSIGGDLWESVLKRERGVKDSGQLLPGHGGVLDRIDSQIAAAPFFVAALLWTGAIQ